MQEMTNSIIVNDGRIPGGHDRPQADPRIGSLLHMTQCMVRPCVARVLGDLAFAVLHQCIRPLIGADRCSGPSWISACGRAHYRTGLRAGAIWVTGFDHTGKTVSPSLRSNSRRPRQEARCYAGMIALRISFPCSTRSGLSPVPTVHLFDRRRVGGLVKAGGRCLQRRSSRP